jgi:hypothetical protein
MDLMTQFFTDKKFEAVLLNELSNRIVSTADLSKKRICGIDIEKVFDQLISMETPPAGLFNFFLDVLKRVPQDQQSFLTSIVFYAAQVSN